MCTKIIKYFPFYIGSVKGIVEAEKRILDGRMEPSSFLQEDKNKIQAAIFYSISSTQKGLQVIEHDPK